MLLLFQARAARTEANLTFNKSYFDSVFSVLVSLSLVEPNGCVLSSLRTVGQNSMEVKTFSQQYVPGNFDLSSMNSTKQGLEI